MDRMDIENLIQRVERGQALLDRSRQLERDVHGLMRLAQRGLQRYGRQTSVPPVDIQPDDADDSAGRATGR
jgi:hypothetical protein